MLQTAEWTFRLASSKKEDQSPVLPSVTHSPPKMFPSHLLLFLLFPTCHFFTIVFQYFVQYSQYFMQYAVKNRQSFYWIFFIATIRSLKYKWQIEIKNGNQLSWAINKAEPRASHSVGEWPSHGWWVVGCGQMVGRAMDGGAWRRPIASKPGNLMESLRQPPEGLICLILLFFFFFNNIVRCLISHTTQG